MAFEKVYLSPEMIASMKSDWCHCLCLVFVSSYGADFWSVMQIGFSAPQGCGKTTLVFALNYLFQITGR